MDDKCLDVDGVRASWPVLQLGVAEAMDGELWRPLLAVDAGAHVTVDRDGCAQWAYSEFAVFDDLGVVEPEHVAGCSLWSDAQAAGDVLAEVETYPTARHCFDRRGAESLDYPHGRSGGRLDVRREVGEREDRGALPACRVELGAAPSDRQVARVVAFALVQSSLSDGRLNESPRVLEGYFHDRTVAFREFQLKQDRDVPPVCVPYSSVEADPTSIPSVRQPYPECVHAIPQRGRHVVGLVADSVQVAGPARG